MAYNQETGKSNVPSKKQKKANPLKGTILDETAKMLDKIPGNHRLTQEDVDSYHDNLKDMNEIMRQPD